MGMLVCDSENLAPTGKESCLLSQGSRVCATPGHTPSEGFPSENCPALPPSHFIICSAQIGRWKAGACYAIFLIPHEVWTLQDGLLLRPSQFYTQKTSNLLFFIVFQHTNRIMHLQDGRTLRKQSKTKQKPFSLKAAVFPGYHFHIK